MLLELIKTKLGYIIGRLFIDFKGKHTLLKFLNNPFKHTDIDSGKSFTVNYFGLKYHGIFSNFIDWGVYYQEGFEKGLIKIFINEIKCKKFDFFIDIGANSGTISLPIAKYLKVICFEPMKYNYKKLKKNYSLNKGLKEHKLFNYGASNKLEEKFINFSSKNANIGTASIVRKYKKDNSKEKILLKKLDKILKYKNKNLIIKIDVEGYEDRVLEGIKKLLLDNNVFVYVETKNKKLIKEIKLKYKVSYPKFWYSKYYYTNKKINDDLIFKNYD